MKKEFLKPSVYERIKDYLTKEKVKSANFQVYQMTITPELAEKIYKYINDENLQTYSQSIKNRRKVKFSYTPNFSVKIYIRHDDSISMCLIDAGAQGHYTGKYRQKEYEEKKQKSMSRLDLYFAIIKKYPNHLLGISFDTGGEQTQIAYENKQVKQEHTSRASVVPKITQIDEMKEGLRVFHPVFGAGTITAVMDKKQGRLKVRFEDHGETILLAAYARLQTL